MTSNAIAFIRSGRFSVTRATWGWGVVTSTNDIAGIVGSPDEATRPQIGYRRTSRGSGRQEVVPWNQRNWSRSVERRRLGRTGHLSSVAILGGAACWAA